MRLWRLSSTTFAGIFDGGYGLLYEGRWNRVGLPVTYAATSPSLCVLEKLVHVEDPDLLPPLAMIEYDIPDETPADRQTIPDLPPDWRRNEAATQIIGDRWLSSGSAALLFVPSAIVPIANSPDETVLINHRHTSAAAIKVARIESFTLDVRLL